MSIKTFTLIEAADLSVNSQDLIIQLNNNDYDNQSISLAPTCRISMSVCVNT